LRAWRRPMGRKRRRRGPSATRLTLMIERLAARLGPEQQRLIRDLLRCLLPTFSSQIRDEEAR
jgi:hypothetical protein